MRNMKILTVLLLGWLMIVNGSPVVAQEVANPKQEKAALKTAKKLRKRLIRGGDFALLAEKYSADPGSARMGGELGFVGPGQLVPEYEKTVANLAPGELSEPVRTPFGYHLIQLIDRDGERFNTRHILIKPRSSE